MNIAHRVGWVVPYAPRVRAAIIENKSIAISEVPDPVPGTGELLIRVRAAGLNNADRMQIMGGYPAPPGSPADIPGLELAGEVVGVGPRVFRFSVGDAVMGVVGGGALAELIVISNRRVACSILVTSRSRKMANQVAALLSRLDGALSKV